MSLINSANDLIKGNPVKWNRLMTHLDKLECHWTAKLAKLTLEQSPTRDNIIYAYGLVRAIDAVNINLLWQLVLTELALLADFNVADELFDLQLELELAVNK